MARLRNARNGVIVSVSDERAGQLGPDYVPVEVEAAAAAEAEAAAEKPAKGTGKAGK